jgi:hypothetical protein
MKTGDVLYWIIVDAQTGEPVMRCESRSEARKYAGTGARICKVVVAK